MSETIKLWQVSELAVQVNDRYWSLAAAWEQWRGDQSQRIFGHRGAAIPIPVDREGHPPYPTIELAIEQVVQDSKTWVSQEVGPPPRVLAEDEVAIKRSTLESLTGMNDKAIESISLAYQMTLATRRKLRTARREANSADRG